MGDSIALLRVSTTKQADQGESLVRQKENCIRKAIADGFKIIKFFEESYSGRKDFRPVVDEIFEYLDQHPGKIKRFYISDIDRLTRGGSFSYAALKKRLQGYGVELIDVTGIIQRHVNTLANEGFEYDWSLKSPSRMAENLKADIANDEVTSILTRLIGQEIRLARRGFRVREANMGFRNLRIEGEYGKKMTVLEPHPTEAPWFISMFQLRAEGLMTDEEICERVNAMGFHTRITRHRERMTRQVIGKRGGKKLTIKQLQRYIVRPIYCGVSVEKWTNYQAVRSPFPGLIDIDTFNRANRGKVKILEGGDGTLSIAYGTERKQRMSANPQYPFRFVVRCPHCKKNLKGSASTGKLGKSYPAYHCDRGHYFRVPVKELHENVENFVKNLRFKKEFMDLFEAVAIDVWRIKQKEALTESISSGMNVTNLKRRQEQLLDDYTNTSSQLVKEKLTEKIELIEKQIKEAKQVRSEDELNEEKIEAYIKKAKCLVEHPSELLLSAVNEQTLRKHWHLVFSELPTYQEIQSGTPAMTIVFDLSNKSVSEEITREQMVVPGGIEPPLTA